MAFEQKFFIDHENNVRVSGLNNKTVISDWKSFYGSFQPMRICIVTPNANPLTAPFYTAEDNTDMELRVSLVLVPDTSFQDAALQSSFSIVKSDWTKNISTKDWTGVFDLDEDDLREIVLVKNPITLTFQFDIQKDSQWTTVCQLPAKIYNNTYLLN